MDACNSDARPYGVVPTHEPGCIHAYFPETRHNLVCRSFFRGSKTARDLTVWRVVIPGCANMGDICVHAKAFLPPLPFAVVLEPMAPGVDRPALLPAAGFTKARAPRACACACAALCKVQRVREGRVGPLLFPEWPAVGANV